MCIKLSRLWNILTIFRSVNVRKMAIRLVACLNAFPNVILSLWNGCIYHLQRYSHCLEFYTFEIRILLNASNWNWVSFQRNSHLLSWFFPQWNILQFHKVQSVGVKQNCAKNSSRWTNWMNEIMCANIKTAVQTMP